MSVQCEPSVDAHGRQAVQRLWDADICRSVRYAVTSPSTNSWALADLRNRDCELDECPRLYLADQQTSGRGRHGRQWISSEGMLTFSLVVSQTQHSREPVDSSHRHLLALAVGVGVARAIEYELAPLRAQLKWPNDVLIDGGKAGGILLEGASACPDAIVIGVGVNVSDRPALERSHGHSPSDLATTAGRPLLRYDLLPSLVESILETIAEISQSPQELTGEFKSRCVLTGHQVQYQQGTQTRVGLCRGVDSQGRLLVETSQGLQAINAGEANRVRAARGGT